MATVLLLYRGGTSPTNNTLQFYRAARESIHLREDACPEFQVAENPLLFYIWRGGTGFIKHSDTKRRHNFHGGAILLQFATPPRGQRCYDNASGYPKPQDAYRQFGANTGGPDPAGDRLWFLL